MRMLFNRSFFLSIFFIFISPEVVHSFFFDDDDKDKGKKDDNLKSSNSTVVSRGQQVLQKDEDDWDFVTESFTKIQREIAEIARDVRIQEQNLETRTENKTLTIVGELQRDVRSVKDRVNSRNADFQQETLESLNRQLRILTHSLDTAGADLVNATRTLDDDAKITLQFPKSDQQEVQKSIRSANEVIERVAKLMQEGSAKSALLKHAINTTIPEFERATREGVNKKFAKVEAQIDALRHNIQTTYEKKHINGTMDFLNLVQSSVYEEQHDDSSDDRDHFPSFFYPLLLLSFSFLFLYVARSLFIHFTSHIEEQSIEDIIEEVGYENCYLRLGTD